jgi:serine/threonine protein phosphatase 1
MGRVLCIGDIHGDAVALDQVLERANVSKTDDLIIALGDICDGFRRTRSVIDTLLQYNVILCKGNHDCSTEGTGRCDFGWALNWMIRGEVLPLWDQQGGQYTRESYGFDHTQVPESHINFIKSGHDYYIDEMNNLYCHGGFNPLIPLEIQYSEDIMWDRKLCVLAQYNPIEGYNKVFVGHTCVRSHNSTDFKPIFYNNLIMMDTGCGWLGKLTIMDVKTMEYWQSDMRNINDDSFPEEGFTYGAKQSDN